MKTITQRSRTAARLSFAASAAFVLLLVALHILRPDLDPSWRFIGHLPFAALLINWSLSRNEARSSARRTLRWTAGLPLFGLVIFVVSMGVMLPRNGGQPGPEVLVG